MHRRLREVGQATGVIEIEVGENDVPYITRVVAQRLNLPDRRLLFGELWTQEESARAQHLSRLPHAAQPVSGVDQHEFGPGLDEQAVVDQAEGHGAAVQMVNAHGAERPRRARTGQLGVLQTSIESAVSAAEYSG